MLQGKVAVIYGVGSIGSTVATAFAAAGAQVHLGGRTRATLDAVAGEIRAAGGDAHTAVVDALDPAAVRQHADRVAAEAGHIDICFNLIGHGDVHGTPLIDMDVEDFARPIESIVRSTFITSQATARHMVRQGSGVILIFGGEGEPMRDYSLGGTLVAFHAQETIRRQLACELGPQGVRVITVVTGGIPETIGDDVDPAVVQGIVDATMIGKAATYEDVGNVAVFAASDQDRMMTAATLNISGGSVID
jgi:NAD(P)-dependent dehydrogenase (short-subunit alcohol dehydrogenase family)